MLTTDEELVCFFEARDVFVERLTQYFVLLLKIFERKCIKCVLFVGLFSPSGSNKHVQAEREIEDIV
jgi:hypothetical protein